jgi:hypothetical protein
MEKKSGSGINIRDPRHCFPLFLPPPNPKNNSSGISFYFFGEGRVFSTELKARRRIEGGGGHLQLGEVPGLKADHLTGCELSQRHLQFYEALDAAPKAGLDVAPTHLQSWDSKEQQAVVGINVIGIEKIINRISFERARQTLLKYILCPNLGRKLSQK